MTPRRLAALLLVVVTVPAPEVIGVLVGLVTTVSLWPLARRMQ